MIFVLLLYWRLKLTARFASEKMHSSDMKRHYKLNHIDNQYLIRMAIEAKLYYSSFDFDTQIVRLRQPDKVRQPVLLMFKSE